MTKAGVQHETTADGARRHLASGPNRMPPQKFTNQSPPSSSALMYLQAAISESENRSMRKRNRDIAGAHPPTLVPHLNRRIHLGIGLLIAWVEGLPFAQVHLGSLMRSQCSQDGRQTGQRPVTREQLQRGWLGLFRGAILGCMDLLERALY